MDERTVQTGVTDHLPPPAGRGRRTTPTFDDPRTLQILTTEHWSLLSARSLVYNEAFARAGMFLTFLSASLVALALVAQGMGFDRDFLLLAAIVLGLDLFIGLATLGRVVDASNDDLRCIAGMNRLRHGYLEIAPELERYFVTSQYDDVSGILSTYGELPERPTGPLNGFLHGLTTTFGMVGTITAAIGGILGAVVALLAGAPAGVALGLGLASFTALFAVATAVGFRGFNSLGERVPAEFPMPPARSPRDRGA